MKNYWCQVLPNCTKTEKKMFSPEILQPGKLYKTIESHGKIPKGSIVLFVENFIDKSELIEIYFPRTKEVKIENELTFKNLVSLYTITYAVFFFNNKKIVLPAFKVYKLD